MVIPLAFVLSLVAADARAIDRQLPAPDLAAIERQLDRARDAVARERTRLDAEARSDLDSQLRLAEDDVAYLRVRARRGESLPERDRRDVSERLDRIVERLGDAAADRDRDRRPRDDDDAAAVPSGTEIDVRLRTGVSSRTATVEQPVEATTMVDLYRGDTIVVPAGTRVEGHIVSVDRASRTDRRGSLGMRFDRLVITGRAYETRLSVTQALESAGLKGEAGRIGAGAGVGAILGGILGGMKGAIAGILIGGGGVVLATEGADVDLPAGTVLRLRFDESFAPTR